MFILLTIVVSIDRNYRIFAHIIICIIYPELYSVFVLRRHFKINIDYKLLPYTFFKYSLPSLIKKPEITTIKEYNTSMKYIRGKLNQITYKL